MKAAAPSLSHYQIKNCILKGVDTSKNLSGLYVTSGRLNLYKSVMSAKATAQGASPQE